MKKSDLAWAAGLFEGEGCFSFRTSYNNHKNGQIYTQYQPTAQISMTDIEILERFLRIIKVGYINGPYQYKPITRKPIWIWRCVTVPDVKAVLNLLKPWLGKRRLQKAKVVLNKAKKRGL